jgi:hypothetical protein
MLYVALVQFSATCISSSHKGAHSVENSWFHSNLLTAFSAGCNNTDRTGCTKVFRCPYSQISRWLRSGDSASQLTGSARSSHWTTRAWFRGCLTMRRAWGGAHHSWTSLVQGLPHNAEIMGWCLNMHEKVWFRSCLTMRRTWGGALTCMNKSGSGAASQCGEHEVVPQHAWTSLVQVLSGNAENMRWCPITHEPYVLSLMERHEFKEYW